MTSSENKVQLQQGMKHGDNEVLGEGVEVLYHLFEDPHFFLAWGLKGAPFYMACVLPAPFGTSLSCALLPAHACDVHNESRSLS